MPEKLLKIGELAAQAGVTAKAIRFYEAAGVLPRPNRGSNGYRLYGSEAVTMLRFIRPARGLDLSLAEIKELIAIRQQGSLPCRHVSRLLADKAAELHRKLEVVTALRQDLRRGFGRQALRKAAVCPHLEAQGSPARARQGNEV